MGQGQTKEARLKETTVVLRYLRTLMDSDEDYAKTVQNAIEKLKNAENLPKEIDCLMETLNELTLETEDDYELYNSVFGMAASPEQEFSSNLQPELQKSELKQGIRRMYKRKLEEKQRNASVNPNMKRSMQSLNTCDQPDETEISGIGKILVLKAKEGTINNIENLIEFHPESIGDGTIEDLNKVLSVGFIVSFTAIRNDQENGWIATRVEPVDRLQAPIVFKDSPEIHILGDMPLSDDIYSMGLEKRAMTALLDIFQRQDQKIIHLRSIASGIPDDDLEYIGNSPPKLRKFFNNRSHLFELLNNDTVLLQHSVVYYAAYKLNSYLLRQGGFMTLDALYRYSQDKEVQLEIRIKNSNDLLKFLNNNEWLFAVFCGDQYVSARRNFPDYDYLGFLREHFPQLTPNIVHRAMRRVALMAELTPNEEPSVPPTNPTPQPDKTEIRGYGKIKWLSPEKGMIILQDRTQIFFFPQTFRGEKIDDLTKVLRVGFILMYKAILNERNQYVATRVQPVSGPNSDRFFADFHEIMLGSSQTTPPNAKDSYVLKLETKAIPALLDLFSSQGRQKIGISSTFLPESILSRDEDLLAYVGKCFTTRREFLRRRTYLFRVVKSEFIVLQHPYVYEAVYKLNSYLLRRGGVTSFDTLFDYYINGDIPKEVRDHNGKLRENLLAILNNHNYIFAMFPGDSYVSSRRNLPNFDYLGFLKKNFPEMLPQSPRVMPEGCTCQCHSSKKVPTFQSPAFEALKLHLDTVTQETHKKLEDVQSNFENILLGKDQNIRDLEEELAHFETHSSDFQNKAAFHKVSRELEATRRQMQEMEARHQLEIAAIKRNNSELTKSVYETVVKLRLGSQPSEEESGSDSSWSRLSGSNSIEQDD